MGGAGAEVFVAGSLSSCLTISVGGSGSFFTSTVEKEQRRTLKLFKMGLLCEYYFYNQTILNYGIL